MMTKSARYIPLVVLLGAGAAYGQGFEQLKPTTPEKAPLATLPAQAPPSEENEILTGNLRGIVILPSIDQFNPQGVPSVTGGVSVHGPKFLDAPQFYRKVAPYIDAGVTTKRTLRQLERDIVLFCRKMDHPIIDVITPDQVMSNGVLQIVVVEGRVGKVTVTHEGKRHWFSNDFIRSQVRLKTGDVISEKKILRDVNWLNQNPFREVSVVFKQGEEVGQTDIQLPDTDRFPLRVYTGYEDTGSRIAGGVTLRKETQSDDRLVFGCNWGNAFGLDHQFNYQYTTDTEFDNFSAHSASYIIPFPWRHTLTLFGSYVDAKTDVGGVSQDAVSSQASFRYGVPLNPIQSYQHEVSMGFDFKNTDNLVKLGGGNIPPTGSTAINQFVLGYSGLLPDRWGSTTLGLEGVFSPGWVDSTRNYQDERIFARRQYEYGRFNVERTTVVPFNFVWILRGMGQVASGNLLVSEQLGLGGYSTVRGYDEREANGDNGWFVSNEIRTPACSLIGLVTGSGDRLSALFHKNAQRNLSRDQFQILGFWDYGVTENISLAPGEDPHDVLSSAGVGFRYTISRYLTMRFDYGWQLHDTGDPFSSRAHVGVIASF